MGHFNTEMIDLNLEVFDILGNAVENPMFSDDFYALENTMTVVFETDPVCWVMNIGFNASGIHTLFFTLDCGLDPQHGPALSF